MADTHQILALKPYLEAVENCCRKLSYQELCDLIRDMAQEVAPAERARFLARLESRPQPEEQQRTLVELDDELLERIRELKEDILERQEAIEDGTYYEEYDDYSDDRGYSGYYDEEIEVISDEQREECANLFAEADHLFLAQELELARRAYRSLLSLFDGLDDEEDEEFAFPYSFSESDIQINWRETRARYARCVYEMASSEDRVSEMIRAMQVDARQFESRYAPSEGQYPLLQDVINARTGELPEREAFLPAWRDALGAYADNRAQILWLEAINLLEGVAAVARAVRQQRMPVGYLYWLDLLTAQHAWQELGAIAQEALQNMPEGPLRAQAAEMLYLAGVETGNQELMLHGKREVFFAAPQRSGLAAWLEEAGRQDVRDEELEQAIQVLSHKEQLDPLKVQVFLMSGRLDEASALVNPQTSLGWSYSAAANGVFLGGLLTALTQADARGVTIHALLQRYAGSSSLYAFSSSDSATDALILREMQHGLQQLALEDDQKQKWLAFAEQMGGGRIDGIVSNQHRKSYDRAAEVLGALMECYLLNDQPNKARLLWDTYRNQTYKRHSAFRKEVDTIMRNSALLRPYGSRK